MMTGNDLRVWRTAIGWTQNDLMEELGVTSRQTVGAWEKSARLPRLVELAIIALDQVESCRDRAGVRKQFSPSSIANTHFSRLKSVLAVDGLNMTNDASEP
jgi:transcriptional regulator with XRE-family HTH domain